MTARESIRLLARAVAELKKRIDKGAPKREDAKP